MRAGDARWINNFGTATGLSDEMWNLSERCRSSYVAGQSEFGRRFKITCYYRYDLNWKKLEILL